MEPTKPSIALSDTGTLAVKCNTSDGRFWLAAPEWSEVLEPVTKALRQGKWEPPHFHALKDHRQRLVLRYAGHTVPLVIKARRPGRWYRRLRHRRAVWQEAQATIAATAAGLPVPAAIGYGIVGGRFGGGTAVMLQHYRPLPTMCDILAGRVAAADTSRADKDSLLERAAASLIRLVDAGCHHVDFGPHAILLAHAPSCPDELIDFEYAQFWERPSARLAAVMGGYFAWASGTNRSWFAQEQLEDWFQQVLDRLGMRGTRDVWSLWHHCRQAREPLRWRMAVR